MRVRDLSASKNSSNPLVLYLLLLFTGPFTLAQQDINFTSLSTKNGLSSNTANAILKDRYGIMWFATEDGLDKFDGSSVTVYRNKPDDANSLPANEVLCLHEDKKGNLWIGTSGGSVSMYNRQQDAFINYRAGNGPNMISNSVIRAICEDYLGRIWIVSFNSVSILDPVTKKISKLMEPNGQPFAKISISICEDRQHFIWIGTSEGLFRYQPSTGAFKSFLHNPADSNSISGNVIACITEDKQGQLWVGTQGGLSRLQANGQSFTNYHHAEKNAGTLTNDAIHAIAADEDNRLWVGTERGLNIIDSKTGEIKRIYYDARNVHGLTSEGVRSIYIDNKGIYWLGTSRGGIDKYDKNLNLFNLVSSNPFDTHGLNAPVVSSFAEQPNGQLFVGTEGGGLSSFDPATKQFTHISLRSKRKGADNRIIIRHLNLVRPDQLLIATLSEGLFIMNTRNYSYRQILQDKGPGSLNSNDIYCVKKDHAGNWWLGTNGGGVNIMNPQGEVIQRLTPKPQYSNDRLLPVNAFIRDILEDSSGKCWLATYGGGLAQYDPTTGKFSIYNKQNSKLPNDKVQSILQDREGNIWAGTFGGGLCIVNKRNGQLTTFTEKEGLQNNAVYKLLEDDGGRIWISTNKGLSSIDPLTRKVSNYNYYNGVQRNNFFHGAGLKTADGSLFFGGLEGFNYFNPAYLKKNTNVPVVLITDLKISNQSVAPAKGGVIEENVSVAKEINLGFKQNFALNFVALNYTAPGQNQYAYKLDNFDKDWNYVGSTSIAHYTNLDPGEYVFRVKASNNDGIWSSGDTSIKIIVHPPIWRTVYAYAIYVLLALAAVLYLRHKSIEKIKRKFKLEQEHKEAERLHEIDQLKIKFLTNLSHEFRTPISLILGPVDKLLAQEENIWRSDHLQMIKRNGKRLLNLVNQLLDFRKMEEHELRLQPTDGELVGFVKEVFDSFKDLAERKKINFRFVTGIDQLSCYFDHDKIERILFNLLSNAFKFTLEGGKIVLLVEKIEKEAADENTSWVAIRVTDSGIGIPADKKEKIFERFFQHTSTAAILNQGSGIGLSITKEFVTMHGGQIEVESEPGKGSSFAIYLPFTCVQHYADEQGRITGSALSQPVATAIENGTDSISTDSPADQAAMASILLVEDNDDFRFYLKENLRQYYKVHEAANGKEGWQRALALHPQLIVSDISMPCMDGIELCKKLKADKRTHHIPVILLTALTAEQDQLKGLQTGANDYITKPFNFELLHSKINNLLVLKDTFKNTYTRQIAINTPAPAAQPEDEKWLSQLMRYLEENMTDSQVSVEQLSKHLGMSRSTLYLKLFELTGQTPVEYIRSVKLEKAAALLENSDMNVAQIAYSVGFATPKYFAKTFKAKYNMLPSEYMARRRKAPVQKTSDDV
ncbi:MAG TPA: two-component regulator propeller domain-containing protein [Chitinophagaceae bacterium]|nr:two-component regulator propeller domain-containing protein [Chitinophagaceae bacterium]